MAELQKSNNKGFLQAVQNGHLDRVIYYLDKGADINVQSQLGLCALQIAFDEDNFQCGKLLLSRGADLWLLGPDQDTVLMRSIKDDKQMWTQTIIEKGMTSSQKDQKNYFILLNDMLPITKFHPFRDNILRIELMHPLPGESLIRIALRAGKWNAAHLLAQHGGQNMMDDSKKNPSSKKFLTGKI